MMLRATQTAPILSTIASCHNEFPFSQSISRAHLTNFSTSNPKLWVDLWLCLLTAAMIWSHLHKTCGTHQQKAGWWSMPWTMEYSTSSTGYDSLRLDSFSQDVELLRHSTQISQPLDIFIWCHLPLIVTCISQMA